MLSLWPEVVAVTDAERERIDKMLADARDAIWYGRESVAMEMLYDVIDLLAAEEDAQHKPAHHA